MRQFLIYILFLHPIIVIGQEYVIESSFTPNKTYEITVTHSILNPDDLSVSGHGMETRNHVIFLKDGKDLKCTWEYGETRPIPDSIYRQIGQDYLDLLNIYSGIKIEFLLSQDSGNITLLNFDNLKKNVISCLLKIYKSPVTVIDSATMLIIEKQLEPKISSPDTLLMFFFPEIGLCFNQYGKKYTKGVEISSEYFQPNPLGKESFPMTSKKRADIRDESLLVLKEIVTADKEEVNRILKEMVESAPYKDNQSEKGGKIPEFDLDCETEYQYDLKNKLIKKIVQRKNSHVDGHETVNHTVININ